MTMTEKESIAKVRTKLGKDCLVWQARKKRFYPEQDIFGCFDLIVLRDSELSLIQVTTIQHISERMKKCQRIFESTGMAPPTHAEVWAWDRRKDDFVIKAVSGRLGL